jgi:hypothetical protein
LIIGKKTRRVRLFQPMQLKIWPKIGLGATSVTLYSVLVVTLIRIMLEKLVKSSLNIEELTSADFA